MKTKTYKFTVTVKRAPSQFAAKMAILCAFATRQPDGCSFNTSVQRKR